MIKKEKYTVHEWVKFDYSEIGQYVDENYTYRPLRNDILVDILNRQEDIIYQLNKLIDSYLPVWVIKNVINRRIVASEDDNIKKELEKLLEELL